MPRTSKKQKVINQITENLKQKEKEIAINAAMGGYYSAIKIVQDMIAKGLVDGSEYSADNLNDPATNIEFGCAYLSYLLTYFNGSTDSAIAAYNAGMGNVDGWAQQNTSLHNAITFPETQAYLIRVNNAWVRYKTLYPDRFV